MTITMRDGGLWADLFWGDLSVAAQTRLLNALGDNGNFDVYPLASINVTPAEDAGIAEIDNNAAITVTIERQEDRWFFGSCGRYKFEAKVYDEPSQYGINGGRISKLNVWRVKKPGELFAHHKVLNYDRGWDVRPQSDYDKAVYAALTARLAQLPNYEEESEQ